ncbi:MAG TPA: hypothetical protein VHW23_17475 [Kofleriaceae bacterium]|jgi:hypothetical protein|nr:hypothetical protein [Kofleriaceae bacterium]
MMTIEIEQLASVHGGMKLDGFRRSDNIEDRRTPFAVQEDDQWMSSLKNEQAGKDLANSLRDAQIADQWRRRSDDLRRAGVR